MNITSSEGAKVQLQDIKRLGDAHQLQKGISRVSQKEADRERSTADPLAPQGKPDLPPKDPLRPTLWDLDM